MESRKVQLETVVNNAGAKEGFQEIKQDAREMAQAVAQAGQQAARGLDGVAQGAKAAGDSWTREDGRIRAAIQRSTLELQSLGKTASQKFEAKIDFKGLDPAKFQADLAALREAEAVSARLAQAQKGESFLGDLRGQIAALRERVQLESMSADEALRYKAAQAGVGAAAAPLILQLQNMRAAQEAVAQAAREEAAAQKDAAAAAARRTSFIDDLRQQADAIGKTRADLIELRAAQLGLSKEAAPYIQRLREAEQSHRGLAAGAKLNAFQTQQLGFQIHDFVVQVASGQNALTAFVQQGSQLSGTFGGAKNAFQAVLSLLTPLRVGMLAGAAAVGVLAAELVHAETGLRQVNTLQAQLAGTGRAGLFSDSGLKDYIRELSEAQGVTREVAGQIVSELAKAHDIGGALFRDLGKLANDYAKATGNTAPAAAAALAKAFSDPAQGAKDLDKALGTLTSTQIQTIERLQRQGDFLGAQRALYDAAAKGLKGIAENGATPLQKAVDDLGDAWNRSMDRLDKSQGLRTVNALLAEAVGYITSLLNNAPKLGGLGNLGLSLVPGGLPGALGTAAGAQLRGLFTSPEGGQFAGRGATGSFDTTATGPAAGAPGLEDRRKRALAIAAGYKSEAIQIAELTDKRKALNAQIREEIALGAKSDPKVLAQLLGGVAGINEQITNIGKRAGQEGNQTRQAALQADLQSFKDRLQEERDALAFHQQYLQGVFSAGLISVKVFYDQRTEAIRNGVRAELAELEGRKERLQKELSVERDPSNRRRLEGEIADAGREQQRVALRGAREVELANQQQREAYRQLSDEVANYRANLLQLQGDEAGAAKIRAEQAIEQARRLAKRSEGSDVAIPPEQVQAEEQARRQIDRLNEAKRATSVVNQALELEEERIADAQRRGAITSIDALSQVGEARRRVVAQLEEIVKAQEEVARSRPQDYQLQIDTARARQELERLKDQLDPLAEKFRTLFTDATGDLFADLANDPKNAKEAITRFAKSIASDLNREMGRNLAQQLFGKDGPLGSLPGAIGDLFRKGTKAGERPLVDTSGVTRSLNTFETTGVQPATSALAQFTQALQAASGAVTRPGAPLEVPFNPAAFPTVDDDGNPMPEVLKEQAKSTEKAIASTNALTEANAIAFNASMIFGRAVAGGADALSLLPQIIRLVMSAVAGAGGGGGGGVIAGLIGSLISGGVSGFQASFSQTALGSSGFGSGLAYGNMDLGLFFANGGYTGDGDPKEVAGFVHGREYVFDAEATARIGRETLERIRKSGRADAAGTTSASRSYESNDRGWTEMARLLDAAKNSASQASGDIHIVNNTTGRVDRAERRTTPDGDQVIVLLEAVAASMGDSNSVVGRAMKRNYGLTRNR